MLAMNTMMRHGSSYLNIYPLISFPGRKYNVLFPTRKSLPAHPCSDFRVGAKFKAFALRRSEKRSKGDRKKPINKISQSKSLLSEDDKENSDGFHTEDVSSYNARANAILDANKKKSTPTRTAVLQACIFTSGVLLVLGVVLRQASHVISMEGWGILDASAKISFDFEVWDIKLIIGLVVLISSCRYILLKTWPDFSESSETANRQVLSSLEPLDILVVALLPGISEELFFRGALLPLFGLNWRSALLIGAVFGILHIGGGRRYPFAIWATFVGFAYGLATIDSSTVIVPMAAHSLNNLIGGILWRRTSHDSNEDI